MIWIISLITIIVSFKILIELQEKKLLETVTKINRGTKTERNLVIKLLKSGISPKAIFHDLYIKKNNGTFSQIDLVVPTKAGVIVFEVKDLKGWIFGTGFKPQWTQVLAYGKVKNRFYNPIIQNKKHIEELKKLLNSEDVPFYSIIVFYGDSELKDINFVPENTFLVKPKRLNSVLKIINSNSPASYKDKHEIIKKLNNAVKNGENTEIQKKHIENIKNMLGKERIFD